MNPANNTPKAATPWLYRFPMMVGVSWLCLGVTTEQSHKHVVYPFHFRDVSSTDTDTFDLEGFENHVRH